jgi:hypothetical protein
MCVGSLRWKLPESILVRGKLDKFL